MIYDFDGVRAAKKINKLMEPMFGIDNYSYSLNIQNFICENVNNEHCESITLNIHYHTQNDEIPVISPLTVCVCNYHSPKENRAVIKQIKTFMTNFTNNNDFWKEAA